MIDHTITFKCDWCDTQYMINDTMQLPANWFGVQIAIANANGYIPAHEEDIYCHFCCQQCLVEYAAGEELRERFYMIDKQDEDNEEEEDK